MKFEMKMKIKLNVKTSGYYQQTPFNSYSYETLNYLKNKIKKNIERSTAPKSHHALYTVPLYASR